jgi:Fe-S cluster assembly iron-binding protein IscA
VAVDKLDGVLRGWKLYPRTREEEAIWIEGAEFAAGDIVLLGIKRQNEPLPATPLPLRDRPVAVGDKVFLLGCPYSEEVCTQNVYNGTVVRRGNGHSFRFSIHPPVKLRGFSGAPVIDENGHAVGVLTASGVPAADGKNAEGGVEEFTPFLHLNDPGNVVLVTAKAAPELNRRLAARGRHGGAVRLARDPGDEQVINMGFTERPGTGDWVGSSNGLTITIPRSELSHLRGTIIDYTGVGDLFLFERVFRRR